MHITIIGGGIAGLATAFYLEKRAREQGREIQYVLLERSDRWGGKITTESVDGFLIEGGPDLLLTQKPAGIQLCKDLGLADRLISTNSDRQRTFLVRDGKLVAFPEDFSLVPARFWPLVRSPLYSFCGKVRMGLEVFVPRRRDEGDESLASFIGRRLGVEAVNIGGAMLAGIHSADAERLSMRCAFPMYVAMEQRYGSLIKGVRAMRKTRAKSSAMFQTLIGGMGELVDALVAQLDGDLRRGVAVGAVRKTDGGFEVVAGDEVIETDVVVMATPAYVSADLVADFAPDLSLLLRGVRYVSTATVSLGYRKRDVEGQHDFEGFGFLSPKHEGRRITACTWVSTKLNFRAPDDGVLVRTFVGGAGREDLVDLDDEALIAQSREELEDLMGLTADPVFARIFRWQRGRPQFDVGHLDRVAEMEHLAAQVGGLFLTGSAYRGSAIPDCIVQAVDTVDRILGEV
ncbi:MAG: protoporphyrinogen oxidase [Candidatus Latescibacteria bacterium]|nr:protoporphyrinogen oxidase [Candidatus Latescibacterota bacterium]